MIVVVCTTLTYAAAGPLFTVADLRFLTSSCSGSYRAMPEYLTSVPRLLPRPG